MPSCPPGAVAFRVSDAVGAVRASIAGGKPGRVRKCEGGQRYQGEQQGCEGLNLKSAEISLSTSERRFELLFILVAAGGIEPRPWVMYHTGCVILTD